MLIDNAGMATDPSESPDPGAPTEAWLSRLMNTAYPRMIATTRDPNIEANPQYLAAREFALTMEPDRTKDYGWVWDYAVQSFERLEKINRILDDKANDIIKYLGGGTGLFTLAAIASIGTAHNWVFVAAIPSFLLALISVYFAALVRQPNAVALPPSIKLACRYVEDFNGQAKATFLGQWHATQEGYALMIDVKSKRLFYATWFFFGAIAALFLPILAALFRSALDK